ncbi:hypothetical protein GCM10017556_21380 [Micromonospora sagamiensis]|nr:hypothetical protein GCM10017556_21380 [Micromonospora sagamiensis]
MLLPDQVQAGVDAGGGARAGQQWTVLDVERVAPDPGQGVAFLAVVDVPPVGRAVAAVEQPGLAEHEGTGADAEHVRATVGGPARRGEHRRRDLAFGLGCGVGVRVGPAPADGSDGTAAGASAGTREKGRPRRRRPGGVRQARGHG